MLTPTVMCSQELCIALNESFADIKKLLYRVCNFFAFQKLLACKGRKHWKGLAITKISDTLFLKQLSILPTSSFLLEKSEGL